MAHWFAQPELSAFSERARARLSEVVAYAALPGAGFLVSPSGTIELFSGAFADLDIEAIAATAAFHASEGDCATFAREGAMVFAAAVGAGWSLCVVAPFEAAPASILERTKRAAGVLRLGMARTLDFGGPASSSGEGGAPAEARVAARRKLN